MIFSLAIKNILRSGSRTMVTLSAIACGAAAIVLSGGFITNTLFQMREAYIRGFLGHIQIHAEGFTKKGTLRPFDYLINEPDNLINTVSALPHVKMATARLEFTGLLNSGENSIPFLGIGIDTIKERTLSNQLRIADGKWPENEKRPGLLAGLGLAKAMRLHPGDSVTLITNTASGGINAMDATVSGIFETASKPFDDNALMLPLPYAQKLLRARGAHTIALLLDNTENTGTVAREIRELSAKEKSGLEIKPWFEIAEFFIQTAHFYSAMFLFLKVVIAAALIIGVFNTLNMSVMERTGEIGTLLALGTTRRQILKLFITEGAILGLTGGLLGLFLGAVLAHAITLLKFQMPTPPGSTDTWIAAINIVPFNLALAFTLTFSVSVFSSFYPALKASRMEITKALRENIGV